VFQFELNELNGTDLRLTGRHVLLHNQAKVYIESKLGDYITHMKSAVWNWSDRFLRVEKHLQSIKAHHENQRIAPAWLLNGINERLWAINKNQ
jgi:hypothetical protein